MTQPAGTHLRCRHGGLARNRRRRWSLLGARRAQLALTEGRRWMAPTAGPGSKQVKEAAVGCVRQDWKMRRLVFGVGEEEIRLTFFFFLSSNIFAAKCVASAWCSGARLLACYCCGVEAKTTLFSLWLNF